MPARAPPMVAEAAEEAVARRKRKTRTAAEEEEPEVCQRTGPSLQRVHEERSDKLLARGERRRRAVARKPSMRLEVYRSTGLTGAQTARRAVIGIPTCCIRGQYPDTPR